MHWITYVCKNLSNWGEVIKRIQYWSNQSEDNFQQIWSALSMYFRCEYYKIFISIFTSKLIFIMFAFNEKFSPRLFWKRHAWLSMCHSTFKTLGTERSDPLQAVKTCLERTRAPGAQYISVPKNRKHNTNKFYRYETH